jgi:hypothetical protein
LARAGCGGDRTENAAQRSMIADAALVFPRSDTEIPAGKK